MGQIQVEKTDIEGLVVITPTIHKDSRGYFMESYNERDFKEAGLNLHFVQDNQSMSQKGVLRGLHFQKEYPQGKLVRVLKGRVYDIPMKVAEALDSEAETYVPGAITGHDLVFRGICDECRTLEGSKLGTVN